MRASDHGQDLLLMARKDFDALRGMLDNPLFADEIFGFHAQQAIEKSLKAWLAARLLSFPLTQVRVECLGRGPAAAWRKKGNYPFVRVIKGVVGNCALVPGPAQAGDAQEFAPLWSR